MTWVVAHFVLVVVSLMTLLAASHLLRERRPSQATLAWLLAIVLVPYFGLLLYLALGTRKVCQPAIPFPDMESIDVRPLEQATAPDRLLRSYGLPGATTGNEFQLLGTGEAAYAALIKLIENAERSIWVTLFILGDDDSGRGFLDALTEAATAGIDVRLLLDAVGSRPFPRALPAPLRAAGGTRGVLRALAASPVSRPFQPPNHRKLFLIDESRALVGGMNVAHEYMGLLLDPGRWRDLSFRLDGPAVALLAALFRSDWSFASRAPLRY